MTDEELLKTTKFWTEAMGFIKSWAIEINTVHVEYLASRFQTLKQENEKLKEQIEELKNERYR